MEEGFSDGSSGALIGAGIFGGLFFSALIFIGVKVYYHVPGNPATITTTPPLPTQGGKRRTRRSRPHRGTRRV
jgi:hypothetical protein